MGGRGRGRAPLSSGGRRKRREKVSPGVPNAAVAVLAAAGPHPPPAGPAAPAGPPGGGGGRNGRRGGLWAVGGVAAAAPRPPLHVLVAPAGQTPPRPGRWYLRGARLPAPQGIGAASALRHSGSPRRPIDAAAARVPPELVLLALPAAGAGRPVPRRGAGPARLRRLRQTPRPRQLPPGAAARGHLRGHRGAGDTPRAGGHGGVTQVRPGGTRLRGPPGLGGGAEPPGAGGQVGDHGGAASRVDGRFHRLPPQPAAALQLRVPVPAAMAARAAAGARRLPADPDGADVPVVGDPGPRAAPEQPRAGVLPVRAGAARGAQPPRALLPQPLPGHPDAARAAPSPHAAALGLQGPVPGPRPRPRPLPEAPPLCPPARAARRQPLAARRRAPPPGAPHWTVPGGGGGASLAAPIGGGGGGE